MMELLGWGILGAFQEAWITGHYDPHLFDKRTPPWLRIGDYRIHLSMDGASLTVQRGKDYGHFIDTQSFAGDWSKVRDGLQAMGIESAPYPASQGRVAAGLLNEYAKPLKAGLPQEVTSIAWQACKGSRMEALSLGTIDGVAYDISSAFPFIAKQLPWSHCRWQQSKEFQPDAYYGFASIQVDIPSDLIAGPLAIRVLDTHLNDMELRFPVGPMRVTVSQPEMRLLSDMGIPFTIRDGWWGYPTSDILPFEELMTILWDLREFDKAGAKTLSVACVGQLGSVIDNGNGPYEARGFWNPVYSAHIYADTRCRVYRKGLEVGLANTRAFTIDGLICSGGGSDVLHRTAHASQFGDWRLESEGRYFLANDYFKDRPGEPARWRGFVESTPDDVPQDRFQSQLDTYIGPILAMQHSELRKRLGQKLSETDIMPLGSDHRSVPKGMRRSDYLAGEIPTSL